MENKGIFVVAEQRQGVIQSVTYELLGAARELASVSKEDVCVILLGHKLDEYAKSLISCGADKVYYVDNEILTNYLTEPYAQAVTQIIRDYNPNVVLYGATSIGRDLAPRISARVNTGLTADCTKLEINENGELFSTRPAFGGNLFATIVSPNHRPQMSTVRPGVMKRFKYDETRKGEIINVDVALKDVDKVKIVKVVQEQKQVSGLETAKIVVGAGRGVGTKEGIASCKELADMLDGALGSSRALVDAGLVSHDLQIGQTGITVRPELYISFGISGAVQHLAGMEESGFIIAINKDKTASIFNVADMGIVGDAYEILPLLKEQIKIMSQIN